jgi:hypothetical protein
VRADLDRVRESALSRDCVAGDAGLKVSDAPLRKFFTIDGLVLLRVQLEPYLSECLEQCEDCGCTAASQCQDHPII